MASSMRGWWAVAVLVLAAPAHAEPLRGRVVGVVDGDTVMVQAGSDQVRVRLAGIDAPEIRQPFGDRSRQNLAALALQKDARLDCHKKDRLKQSVCKVWVQPVGCPGCGTTLDVGHAQVLGGMAWWRREHIGGQTLEDRGRYESAEKEARLRKWGLWRDANPVAPWQWQDQPQPSAGAAAPAKPAPRQGPVAVTPPKPYCDRKDDKAKGHAEIVCGWR